MSDDCQFSPFLREGIARLDRERQAEADAREDRIRDALVDYRDRYAEDDR